ncbi:MAG: hypothetical protein ACOVNY_06145 [Chitinophagaceae bacterium]
MNQINSKLQPWIGKPIVDIAFILLPPFGCLLFIAIYPELFSNNTELSEVWWVILVLLIDVAHVYSTLYRTYFNNQIYSKQKQILLSIPLFATVTAIMIYSFSSILFWRILAYIAVFHFIRQQYGFMRIYSRKEQIHKWFKNIDTITIYVATLFPIIYWHLNSPRNFNWFIEGDFYIFQSKILLTISWILYVITLIVYAIKEIIVYIKIKYWNAPRIAIITGTILSWYFGIVYFNGDMAFTLLNVISHGVPYMALIWIDGKKRSKKTDSSFLQKTIFSKLGILIFLLIIFLLAYFEEALWNMFVWKDGLSIFTYFTPITIDKTVLNIIVPILALPQITHYIIDGFIWKIKDDDFKWSNEKIK